MSYTLYIADHCSSCDKAVRYLSEKEVSFHTINLNRVNERPQNVMIVPALLKDGKLLAFGPDIPSYFKKIG